LGDDGNHGVAGKLERLGLTVVETRRVNGPRRLDGFCLLRAVIGMKLDLSAIALIRPDLVTGPYYASQAILGAAIQIAEHIVGA
jgi:hypothetical protein